MKKIITLVIGDSGVVNVMTKKIGDINLSSVRIKNNISDASFIRLMKLCKKGKFIGERAKASTGFTSHIYCI